MARYKQDDRHTLQFMTGSLDLMLPTGTWKPLVLPATTPWEQEKEGRKHAHGTAGRCPAAQEEPRGIKSA